MYFVCPLCLEQFCSEKQKKTHNREGKCIPTKCSICKITLNSPLGTLIHYNGKRHKAKVATARTKEKELEEKPKGLEEAAIEGGCFKIPPLTYKCFACNIIMDSPEMALQHYNGNEHKTVASSLGRSEIMELNHLMTTTITNEEDMQFKPIDEDGIKCRICNVVFNSLQSAAEHNNGRRHQARAMVFLKRKENETKSNVTTGRTNERELVRQSMKNNAPTEAARKQPGSRELPLSLMEQGHGCLFFHFGVTTTTGRIHLMLQDWFCGSVAGLVLGNLAIS